MLNEDYKEILQLLLNKGCDFVIVGAYALAAHGFPRATGDIDLFISTDPLNVEKVFEALIEFGAPVSQLSKNDLQTPGNIFQIGVAPCRIDIITRIDGVDFSEAFSTSDHIEFEGLSLPFLSRNCLIKNKRASGRTKDLADIEYLEEGS